MLEGFGGFAFDDVAQSFLAAIGLGQIQLIEDEQRDGKDGGDGNDRHGDAVEAHPGGLHGGELAVAVHDAEDHQHADEDAERRDEVNHAGGEIDEVLADGDEGSLVFDDVAEQLEEGEDEHEHDKGNEHHYKCQDKFAEHVLVEDERKAAAGAFAGSRSGGGGGSGGFFGTEAEPVADGGKGGESGASGGHLAKQDNATDGESDVGLPDTEEGGKLVLAREGGAGGRKEVVDEDEADGEHETGALAAAPRGDAERDADEHQDQAGRGIGEALFEFNFVEAAVAAVSARKNLAIAHGEDGSVAVAQVKLLLGAGFE